MITKSKAYQLRRMIEKASVSLSDEDALEAIELYPAWKTGTAYTVDERIRYGETLYRCVQAHTSQDNWTPDITPALWVVVSLDEFPEWIQPVGSADAYPIGAKVSHNGLHWQSDVDSNVWEPGVFGWSEVN